MKKILIPALSLLLLYACSGNKVKDKSITKTEEQTPVNTPTSDMSAEDKLIKEWLQEKEWKAESDAAPITTMKLHSDGMADFVYGKDPWVYKNGFFAMRSLDFVKWPFKKIDDQTFTLFVEPTQKTFVYKFVKNL
jgi:hypothetical protein